MREEKIVDPQNPKQPDSACGESGVQAESVEETTETSSCSDAGDSAAGVEENQKTPAEGGEAGQCCNEAEAEPHLSAMEQKLQEQAEALAKLEEEKKELTDRLLRLQADFDNFRRRTRAEMASLADAANAKVFVELLPIVDNLERALAAESADKAFQAGVAMVLRQFVTTLEKMGVVPISAVGQEFDPTKHEAIMRVEATEEFPSGTVVEVLQKGYMFKDKVLRPSMVKVAG